MAAYIRQVKITSLQILTSKVIKFRKAKMIKPECKVSNKVINNIYITSLLIKLIRLIVYNKNKNSIHPNLNRLRKHQERPANKSKKYFSNMSKRCPPLRLSKWLFLRIIIDQKLKIIRAMQILKEVRFIIRTRKRIIVLLRIVKIV